VVFIAGAEDGLVPMPDNIEEERRLFYVALTRARDRLFISHCAGRPVRGEWKLREPSRFLADIPPDCRESSVEKKDKKDKGQLALF
jgi:superfamily I DNA/RNA helicase